MKGRGIEQTRKLVDQCPAYLPKPFKSPVLTVAADGEKFKQLKLCYSNSNGVRQ